MILGARERKCCLGKFLDSMAQIHKDFHAQSPVCQCARFPCEVSHCTRAEGTKI